MCVVYKEFNAPQQEVLLICDLYLVACLTILGPGAISYTPLLERVAEHRIETGWGRLPAYWRRYDVLVATPGCEYLGKAGWVITSKYGTLSALVVDCTHDTETMPGNGLLVDGNCCHHDIAWLVLEP